MKGVARALMVGAVLGAGAAAAAQEIERPRQATPAQIEARLGLTAGAEFDPERVPEVVQERLAAHRVVTAPRAAVPVRPPRPATQRRPQ